MVLIGLPYCFREKVQAAPAEIFDRFQNRFKNATILIDFAIFARRTRRLSAEAAIREACDLRFRPILMTTMVALLGALPLTIGSGEGAEMRKPLGIAIVGGLVVSQMLTLYTTPVVYLYIDRLQSWLRGLKSEGLVPQPLE